ncbi:amino acid permease [Bacillus cereus group sp. BY8-1LC]|uniref:amino acid permease n=1 Tax=Bacillus cereus group sp. BY8-1LC TaxID=3018076 RepID=UPI0022E263BA|nr:amino acid permease [Bacillus cereus group sp. BY8-1LC]MDA1795252.1 amino acid permease [Bacillus cereus group sp. BY8-1LC]
MSSFTRKKSIEDLQRKDLKNTGLNRVLGLWQLIAIGLGGIIGVGIFVLTGVAASQHAGPAVILSFIIAGLASAAAALCYAEFAGLIPVSGSAYTYSYAVLGEGVAWLIGWDLLLEYILVVGVVAIGWSGYMQELLQQLGVHIPVWAQGAPGTGDGHRVDVIASIISLAIAGLLILGMEWGSKFNTLMVIIKVSIILVVIGVGVFYIDSSNWDPFMPFGFNGVMGGAALVFFAVFGYDTLTTAAEEAKNPQRDLPRAVIISLIIALCLYIGMSLVITGMAPYHTLNNAAPVAKIFSDVGLKWITLFISAAAITGILSVLFSFTLAGSRVWFAMSRDGLLPRWFSTIHPKYKTPHRPTLIIGIITAIISGFTPISELAELVNIGTLSAFILICSSIIVLRKKRPDLERKFKTPFVPIIPLIGICFSIYLIISLPKITWIRFVIWMLIGLIFYILYGRNKSNLAKKKC